MLAYKAKVLFWYPRWLAEGPTSCRWQNRIFWEKKVTQNVEKRSKNRIFKILLKNLNEYYLISCVLVQIGSKCSPPDCSFLKSSYIFRTNWWNNLPLNVGRNSWKLRVYLKIFGWTWLIKMGRAILIFTLWHCFQNEFLIKNGYIHYGHGIW